MLTYFTLISEWHIRFSSSSHVDPTFGDFNSRRLPFQQAPHITVTSLSPLGIASTCGLQRRCFRTAATCLGYIIPLPAFMQFARLPSHANTLGNAAKAMIESVPGHSQATRAYLMSTSFSHRTSGDGGRCGAVDSLQSISSPVCLYYISHFPASTRPVPYRKWPNGGGLIPPTGVVSSGQVRVAVC